MDSTKLTPDGFLINWQSWTVEVAEELASIESITLNDEYWFLITVCREFYTVHHTSPPIRKLVGLLKNYAPHKKVDSLYLQRLFPKGAAKQLNKISGLPKPRHCV